MPLTRITVRQFEAFVAVAQSRSFAAAARHLGLTPSAVSQLVAELESITGFRVFDRSTRRVDLSSAGRDFLGPAETVLRQVQLAEAAAADVRSRAAGVVRIAAPLVLAGSVLPLAMKDFRKRKPRVVVRLCDTPVERLVDAVETAQADLALGPDRAHGPAILRECVFDSPWVLWCAPRHPLARRRTLRWDALRDTAVVAAGRDYEEASKRIAPVEVVEHITTALGLAAQGHVVTLAPAYVDDLAGKLGLVMRRVVEPEIIRHVCIYRPAARSIPPAAQAFAEFLVEWLRKWNGRREAGRLLPRGRRA